MNICITSFTRGTKASAAGRFFRATTGDDDFNSESTLRTFFAFFLFCDIFRNRQLTGAVLQHIHALYKLLVNNGWQVMIGRRLPNPWRTSAFI